MRVFQNLSSKIIITIWACHHPYKRANFLCAYSPFYRDAVGLFALQGNLLLSLMQKTGTYIQKSRMSHRHTNNADFCPGN